MDRLIRSQILVIGLAVTLALIGGACKRGDGPTTSSGGGESTPTQATKVEYPPLASGLANAEFKLLDGNGTFKVSENKGKVMLLNIWGTWCGPCRAEMPHLVELQEKYRDDGFEVIGLNIGNGQGSPEPIDLIKQFSERMKLNYTIAISDNASTVEFYKITQQQVVPQSLLVDREGKLRGMFIGGGMRVIGTMKETVDKVMAES
jgi:thiol-disulfide isomerase/thioredoxin